MPGATRRLPIGAEIAGHGVHFRVWAPAWKQVTLVLEAPVRREIALAAEPHGHHAQFVDGIGAGARYRFRLGDQLHADPASRAQPDGPFGPSEVIDPADSAWTDAAWPGITDPARQVIYELHLGTFTPEGTFAAAAAQLPFLVDVGITTIELMPVNEFAGHHGWGYDGVNLFAPHHHYGTPAELRAFVDRAHALGLAVIVDVVYNHFGPAGNSHFVYAPELRRTDIPCDWGDTLDYRQLGLREFVISNARYWIDEFHVDGLRLDATHAIHDDGPSPHILAEITRAAHIAARTKRIWIVAENDTQDRRLVTPIDQGGFGIDAVWNDDFEHAARIALTGVTEGYLHDYQGTPQELISALQYGFLYQGQLYSLQRKARGTSTRGLAASCFVHFLENHDQLANSGLGDRLITLTDRSSFRALTAVLLLGPQIPMLFHGQETGSTRPWRFFCDHDPELNALVRKGRAELLQQFARLATPEAQAALHDPGALATFTGCILDPADRDLARPCVRLHRDLLRIRRETPCFLDGELRGEVIGEHALCLRWWHDTGERLLLVNLGPTFRKAVLPHPLLAAPPGHGWTTVWSSEHPTYGGHGTPVPFSTKRLAIPARCAVLLAPDPTASLCVEPPAGDR